MESIKNRGAVHLKKEGAISVDTLRMISTLFLSTLHIPDDIVYSCPGT